MMMSLEYLFWTLQVHNISQESVLFWFFIPISKLCVLSHFNHVQLFATLWTVAFQAPIFMGFSRQEYWSGLPCPPPGDLPDPGTELVSLNVFCVGQRLLYHSSHLGSNTPDQLNSTYRGGPPQEFWNFSVISMYSQYWELVNYNKAVPLSSPSIF